jgi:hypothetical protein
MSFKHESSIDEGQIATFLKDAVARVKSEEDPEVLNELKKIYKQNVPFTLRMYVAAYLVKQSRGGLARFGGRRGRDDFRSFDRDNRRESRHDERDSRDSRRNDRDNHHDDRDNHHDDRDNHHDDRRNNRTPRTERVASAEQHEHLPRVQIDSALATTIFVGIGRNRRVYPRDLVGLLVSVASLDRERIGDIRVLANYSFIQLFTEDADKAINALNDYDYRGRKLSVSYSRQKVEGDEEESEGAAETAVAETAADSYSSSSAPVASESTEERIPDVQNVSAPLMENSSAVDADTVAQQAAFAKAMESAPVPTDEEIAAARAPRSSSSDVAEAAPESN